MRARETAGGGDAPAEEAGPAYPGGPSGRASTTCPFADWRSTLVLCLPALVVAVGLRIILMQGLPWAVFDYDTHDFLATADAWWARGEYEIHRKKVPVVPVELMVLTAAPVPALRTWPCLQHGAGILVVLVFGFLSRAWFARWRIAAPVVAMGVAVNPFLLVSEHTVLAECQFILGTGTAVLAGAWYLAAPSWWRWGALAAACLFAAGVRPEGKFLFILPVACAMAGGEAVRGGRMAVAAAGVALGGVMWPVFSTSQTGVMPLTSVVHWVPDTVPQAPGIEPWLLPIRDDVRARFGGGPTLESTATRKRLGSAIAEYLKAHPDRGRWRSDRDVNRVAKEIAGPVLARNLLRLPALALRKLALTLRGAPVRSFTEDEVGREISMSMARNVDRMKRLGVRLAGRPLESEEAIRGFVAAAYRGERVGWFNAWFQAWQRVVAWPLEEVADKRAARPFTVSAFLVVACVGVAVAVARGGGHRRSLGLAALVLAGLTGAVYTIGGIEGRFRVVLEPFLMIGVCLAVEAMVAPVAERMGRRADGA